MTRLADEIDTLLESTVGGRLHTFEPVRAKRRQLLRRRYTRLAGATAVVAAVVVGLQLAGGSTGNGDGTTPASTASRAAPTSHVPDLQSVGLPHLAGTIWSLDTIGNGPETEAEGGVAVPAYLAAKFTFSSDTAGVLAIGDATNHLTITLGQDPGTVFITEGPQGPLGYTDDIINAEDGVSSVLGGDLEVTLAGAQMTLLKGDGEVLHLTRLVPVPHPTVTTGPNG